VGELTRRISPSDKKRFWVHSRDFASLKSVCQSVRLAEKLFAFWWERCAWPGNGSHFDEFALIVSRLSQLLLGLW